MPGGWYEGNVSITLVTFLTHPFPHVLFLDLLRKSSLHPRTRGQFLPEGAHPTPRIFNPKSAHLGAGTEQAHALAVLEASLSHS